MQRLCNYSVDVREGIQLPLHGVAIDWYCSDPLIQHFSRSDNTLELKKFSIYASTLSLNTSPARSCRTLHYCPWDPMADLDPHQWLNLSLFVCSTLTCDVIRTEKLNGFVQSDQDLGETHPESHGSGVVFRGVQGEGEQTAMFLTGVCGAERRSSSILTSNSMLWQKKLLQSMLYKWGSVEWKQPCIFITETLMLGPVPASTF